MKLTILRSVICSLSLVLAASLHGAPAEDLATGGLEEAAQGATALPTGSLEVPEATVRMSPATVTPEEKATLAVAQDQNKQPVYTAMAPGICLVVDDIVRQFCAANPDDISCQFQ